MQFRRYFRRSQRNFTQERKDSVKERFLPILRVDRLTLVSLWFSSASVKGAPRLSMLSLLRNIITQEGVAGLYRGVSPNLLKVVPAVSVSYVVYEYMRMMLGVDIDGRRLRKG